MCAWDLKWKGILLKHNHFNDSWRCWNLLVLPVAPVRCILCQFDLPLLFLNSILFCVRACVCVFYSFEILDYYFFIFQGRLSQGMHIRTVSCSSAVRGDGGFDRLLWPSGTICREMLVHCGAYGHNRFSFPLFFFFYLLYAHSLTVFSSPFCTCRLLGFSFLNSIYWRLFLTNNKSVFTCELTPVFLLFCEISL